MAVKLSMWRGLGLAILLLLGWWVVVSYWPKNELIREFQQLAHESGTGESRNANHIAEKYFLIGASKQETEEKIRSYGFEFVGSRDESSGGKSNSYLYVDRSFTLIRHREFRLRFVYQNGVLSENNAYVHWYFLGLG